MKYLRALDIETGKVVWEIPEAGATSGDDKRWAGVLATAGGVVFHGFSAGTFSAVDERDGRPVAIRRQPTLASFTGDVRGRW
jgi:alcohol dehydrogenase (cytochrome c)